MKPIKTIKKKEELFELAEEVSDVWEQPLAGCFNIPEYLEKYRED